MSEGWRIEVGGYLSERLGSPVEVDSLKQTFPGASRETWLVQARVSGRPEGFAIRIDLPEGLRAPLPLVREYQVYRRLYGSEIPVAEPLWYDEGVAFAQGRPHMVRRLVDGSTNIAGLTDATPDGAALRKQVAFEAMEKLALVHRLDWKSLGFDEVLPAPPDAASCLRTEFDIWRGLWNKGREDPDPVMVEALCWLAEQIPADTPRIMLVKGNNGVGEEIFRDGRIVAMSDWELASLGDGALDLAFSQGTMQLADFGEILRHYEQCVGDKVSPERLAFSGFLIWLKQIVCIRSSMLGNYVSGRSDKIVCVSLGLVHAEGPRSRLARCIGRNIVDAWREVVADELNIYASLGGSRQ